MSREVRPVALDWEHPVAGSYYDGSPRYVPLHSREDLRLHLEDYHDNPEDREDGPPDPADYMPPIPEGHPYGWQLYETVSEGSPLSPVCASKDDLAAWMSSPAAGRDRVAPGPVTPMSRSCPSVPPVSRGRGILAAGRRAA